MVLEAPVFLEPWQARALAWRLRTSHVAPVAPPAEAGATPKSLLTAAIADGTRNCSTTHDLHRHQAIRSKAQRPLDSRNQRICTDLAPASRGQTPHQYWQHVARKPCTRVLTSAKCLESSPRSHLDSRLEDARQPRSRAAARRIPLLRDPRRRFTTQAIPPANSASPGGARAHGPETKGRAVAGLQC